MERLENLSEEKINLVDKKNAVSAIRIAKSLISFENTVG